MSALTEKQRAAHVSPLGDNHYSTSLLCSLVYNGLNSSCLNDGTVCLHPIVGDDILSAKCLNVNPGGVREPL